VPDSHYSQKTEGTVTKCIGFFVHSAGAKIAITYWQMRFHGTTLGAILFSGMLLLTPSSVHAQGSGPASTQRLASEYQKLRADLDRVNAEVATLKRAERGVRNDYLLRDKMAEAEALARKVTAAEDRLRATRGPLPADPQGGALEAPVATPQDGAVELEAKADLLSDQARRFQAEADALAHTAQQIRSRQALRRRAGAWDRDPLAGFEASKRSLAVPAQSSRVAAADNGSGASSRGSAVPTANGATKSAGGGVSVVGEAADSAGATQGATPVFGSSAGPGGTATIALSPPTTTTTPVPVVTSPTFTVATPAASRPLTAPTALSSDSKIGVQPRPLLDPATLATIRSSLTQAGSLSDPDAVEAAASALRKHAQALEERARRLRARAGQ
jgi:hypothetical protein